MFIALTMLTHFAGGAVSCIMDDHHFTNTTEDTCAAALQGGCDLDCGGLLSQCAQAVTEKTRGLGEEYLITMEWIP